MFGDLSDVSSSFFRSSFYLTFFSIPCTVPYHTISWPLALSSLRRNLVYSYLLTRGFSLRTRCTFTYMHMHSHLSYARRPPSYHLSHRQAESDQTDVSSIRLRRQEQPIL